MRQLGAEPFNLDGECLTLSRLGKGPAIQIAKELDRQGRKEARDGPKEGEGFGTAGLILGIVAIVLTVPWGIFVAMS